MKQKNLQGTSSWLMSNFQKKLENLTNHQHSLLKELSLVVLLLLIPLGMSAQCIPDIAGIEAELPDAVTVTVTAKPGVDSYFTVDIADGTDFLTATGIAAWCADQDGILDLEDPVQSYDFDVYSSYDLQGLQALDPGIIENPGNFDTVNWLLNQSIIGTTSPTPDYGTYTFGHVQYAIWLLLDDSVCELCTALTNPPGDGDDPEPWNTLDEYDIAKGEEIAALALANGEGFTPGCGDLIGIVLIPDGKQSLIITKEVPPLSCQDDTDGDGVNDCDDICEGYDDTVDTDSDGVPDGCDICEGHDDSVDTDGDGVPDGCDICEGHEDSVDTDGDGVPDGCDICEGHDDSVDTDGDGVPDGCDICEGHDDSVDTDGDGVPDGCDICEGHDDSIDTDGDGVPDGCDICEGHDDSVDTDGDGVPDGCDICEGHDDSVDTDGDGVPDGCDICEGHDDSIDTDGDGVPDGCDICEGHDDSVDTDGDGVPDGCDICEGHDDSIDTDGDGVPDGCDICEGHEDSVDTDGDGVPDGCDVCEGYDDGVDTDGDGVPDGCDDDEVDCGTCDGKVTELKLQYNGTADANIVVKTKKKGETSDTKVVFDADVAAGGMFSFVGNDKKGTLGTEITIYVNGVEHTKIHTSCSKPIGPGLISGDFEVISGSSRNGGELCPVDTPPDDNDDDCECDGKVTELKLQYNGTADSDIVVETKKEGEYSNTKVVFDETVAAGGMFSFVGNDKKGTLGTEITIYVNGVEHTKIHTSCSVPIGPGLISGDFEVISGSSRNGGELCPVNASAGRSGNGIVFAKEDVVSKVDFNVKSWPNPSDNQFNVRVLSPNLTDKVNIEVFDMRSRLIHKNQFNGNTDYNFGDNFNAGLYFVRIQQGQSVETIKLMKR